MDDYLAKPVDHNKLISVLNRAWNSRKTASPPPPCPVNA
jgi:YesN/AraC family two-component response regulator